MTVHGLLLSDDLIFSSRITGAAASHGLLVRVARSPAQLVEMAGRDRPGGVILDLHHPALDLPALLAALAANEAPPRPRVTAYGSHVAADVLRAAREAGCDLVLPRSKFVEDLPGQLPTWLTP